MKVTELVPTPMDRIRFSYVDYKKVPEGSGCYALTTFDGFILYVGLASRFVDRFNTHLQTPEKVNPTEDGKAIWFYFLPSPTHQTAMLERTWLNQFANMHGRKPILNKIDSPVS
jgi:hypothetical protein